MNNFKNFVKVFIFGLILSSLFTGCGNLLNENSSNEDIKYGSFTVETDRSVDASQIKKAVVSVVSSDYTQLVSKVVDVTDGKAEITIDNIPVGKNRIISVQAYSDDNATTKIEGVKMSLVKDINEGANSGTVNWESTKKGNVYTSLKAASVDIANLTDAQEAEIDNAIPTDVSAALIDSTTIAKDYKSGSLKSSSNYKLENAKVEVTSSITSGYTIQVSDPYSKVQTLASTNSITDAAPGTWNVYVVNTSTKEVVAVFQVVVAAGETTKVDLTDGSQAATGTVDIYVSGSSKYTACYAWEKDTNNNYLGNWPGSGFLTSGDYKKVSIEASTPCVILSENGSNQTADLEISGEGSWLYNETSKAFEAFTPSSGGSSEITGTVTNPEGYEIVSSDSITVHAKYPYVYIWNTGKSFDKTTVAMKDDTTSGWYKYTISATSASLIFKTAEDWSGSKTGDLSRSEAGEFWFLDGKWYDGDPSDSEAPSLVSFTADKSGTVTGVVTFTIEATDNLALSKAVVTVDSSEKTVTLSGKSYSGTFEVDTDNLSNGSHTVTCIVYDGAGNASNTQTASFTTKNPPKASINGAGSVRYSADSTFSYGGSSTVTSYDWTVTGATIKSGSGTSSIVVSAPASGDSFTVSLKVTNTVGSDSTSKTVKLTDGATGDFRDETIYFLMTTRFYDGDTGNNEYCWDEGGEYLAFGEGDCAWRGDFKGLIDKLDYIKALGFSAIWITPVVVNASGIDYHGYHAFDFSHVDPRYATAAQQSVDLETAGDKAYQELIDACHAKGIKVIQDIVLNHSGNFGEKNIFPMFEKETTPYVNKDVATPAGGKRSPFMKVAGAYTSKLQEGLTMAGGTDYDTAIGSVQYAARINAMKEDSIDKDKIYHHNKTIDWNSENCQLGQMAGDCVDLNTENPTVFNYLKDCYVNYINMGVDAFRIDTVKHISRLTFNEEFIPAFMDAGGDSFYIFGETCARYRGRWNEGVPALSPSFYTWKEDSSWNWSSTDADTNSAAATAHFTKYRSGFDHPAWSDGIANHLLSGNNYHTPDYSMRSHLDQIDFPMHWAFSNANDAFSTAVGCNDPDFNDATWNVVYVDSHDYAPDNAPENQRYAKPENWPKNMNLMFTFRGIPCLYYGSEIRFNSGMTIDPANTRTSLDNSGRAYFGDYLEGTVTATDYGEYTASGTVASTLSDKLAQHVIRLNKIRRSISALRKGQYSTEGCSGDIAFKRRYTDSSVDSFALVAIGGQATFTGVPSGTYIEVVTGKTVSCSGTLTSDVIGNDNMRVYVLQTSTCEVSGKIGSDGEYLN